MAKLEPVQWNTHDEWSALYERRSALESDGWGLVPGFVLLGIGAGLWWSWFLLVAGVWCVVLRPAYRLGQTLAHRGVTTPLPPELRAALDEVELLMDKSHD
jgi:hypothetical protein